MGDIQVCTYIILRFCTLRTLETSQTYLHHSLCAHVHAADSQEEAGKGTLHSRAALQRLLNLIDTTHTSQ
jgi:hypothetical protein